MSSHLLVRPYQDDDWSEWLRMSLALFPNQTSAEAEAGMREFHARDGCETTPVGYVEAWYVDPDVRRLGYGRALLAAAEDWARARGYREIASDTQLDKETSRQAHVRGGYAEVDRIIQFRKPLT